MPKENEDFLEKCLYDIDFSALVSHLPNVSVQQIQTDVIYYTKVYLKLRMCVHNTIMSVNIHDKKSLEGAKRDVESYLRVMSDLFVFTRMSSEIVVGFSEYDDNRYYSYLDIDNFVDAYMDSDFRLCYNNLIYTEATGVNADDGFLELFTKTKIMFMNTFQQNINTLFWNLIKGLSVKDIDDFIDKGLLVCFTDKIMGLSIDAYGMRIKRRKGNETDKTLS